MAIGKYKKGEAEQDLCLDYISRANVIGRNLGITPVCLDELDTKLTNPNPKKESALILDNISNGTFLICLDEKGKDIGSVELAKKFESLRDSGTKEIVFTIGGADGHDETLRKRANLLLAFGKMTWPHKLVRAMAAEQIYRSVSIIAKTPYHRA